MPSELKTITHMEVSPLMSTNVRSAGTFSDTDESGVDNSQNSDLEGGLLAEVLLKHRGTVGMLGSIAIAVNTLTGPAMLQLPATFQRSGIIPTSATIIFVSLLCSMCALNLANVISKVPGNSNFSKEIEYSETFRIFWGRSWFIFTQIAFTICILCQLLASIVDVAQVVDTYMGSTIAQAISLQLRPDGTTEFVTWDLSTSCETANGCVAFNRPSDSRFLFTGGYILSAVLFLPLGLLDLKENVTWQIVGFFMLLVFTIQFIGAFISSGLDTSNLSWWGDQWTSLFGVVLFNFSVVTAVPAWLYERHPSVDVPTVIHSSCFGSALLYILVGSLGALSMPHVDDNMISSMIAGSFGPALQIGASLFAFFIVGLGIPFFSILLRLNLTGSGLCSVRMGNFIAVWLPWGLSWIMYQGSAIQGLLAWGGVLCTSVVAFIAPLLMELHASYMQTNRGSIQVFAGLIQTKQGEIRALWVLSIVTVLSVLAAIAGLAWTGTAEEKIDMHYQN